MSNNPSNMIPNPDKEFIKNLRKRIKANSGYCPCHIEKTPDNKCLCKDFRENGECICGLFIQDPESLMGEFFP